MSKPKKTVRIAAGAVRIRAAASAPVLPLEIISTVQTRIGDGTSVTWTAMRSVGAKASAWPAFYMNTLPGNAPSGKASSYNLRSIACQARLFEIELSVTDRDVVYYVTPPVGDVRRVAVAQGGSFMVPQRVTADGETNVALTFDGESCTLRAVPKPETTTTENGAGLPAMPKDPDPDPQVFPPAPPEP
jgi:hypothetical protein